MEALVTALQGVLNFNQITSNLATLLPVIGGVVIFAFTWRLIRRMISGAQKGKAKI